MMFKFVQCSKNDVQVRSMFDKMVFDPSLTIRQHYKTKSFGQGNPIDSFRDSQKLHMTVFSVRLKLRNVKLLIRFED